MSLFRDMLHIAKSISFCKFILFSLLTKCLRGPDEMAWQAGFGLRAVVWRPWPKSSLFSNPLEVTKANSTVLKNGVAGVKE